MLPAAMRQKTPASWKPGQSGNPSGGAPVLPPEVRLARRNNRNALILLIAKYFSMTDEEANQETSGPRVSLLEEAVYRLITRAAKDGDIFSFKYLIEIVVGKIPETEGDEFSEEDLRILHRIKELRIVERRGIDSPDSSGEPESS